MSSIGTGRAGKSMFKQVDMGQSVVLNDDYLLANQKESQVEAIVLKTMEHAENQARLIIGEAEIKAKNIISDAMEQAERSIKEGLQEKESIIQKGYQEGYEAGLQEGLTRMIDETSDKIKTAEVILDKAFEAEALLVQRYRFQITELIQYVIKLILNHELKTMPAQIADLIDKAASRIEFTGSAKIIMHPETLQQLKTASPQVLTTMTNLNRLSFGTDDSCGPYEMYLETIESCFDISPESQTEVYMNIVSDHLSIEAETAENVQDAENPADRPNDELFINEVEQAEDD